MLSLLLLAVLASVGGAAPQAREPRVLISGDSMVQPLDRQLANWVRAAGGRVFRRPKSGTGLTETLTVRWRQRAAADARRYRPQATVMFIGANDSLPLRAKDGRLAACCRLAWVDAYAERAARMMRAYLRGPGRHVYWLTLPAPYDERDRPHFTAINVALGRAAASVGGRAHIVDVGPALSPGNRFHRAVRYQGRRTLVRQRDGVHLTRAGSRIARDLVWAAMRADGLLG